MDLYTIAPPAPQTYFNLTRDEYNDIQKAYLLLRKLDQTIPDETLEMIKQGALHYKIYVAEIDRLRKTISKLLPHDDNE